MENRSTLRNDASANPPRDPRRSIAIMAHIDAGKTTLSERMLWKAGAIRRPGEVHEGSATMDGMDLERERGITINSAAIRFAWSGWEFSLVDTPGHVDFSMEVERSLKAVDGAVLAVCAVAGAQPQTEGVWRRARKAGLGVVVAVNKMDREGADFEKALASAGARLGARPLAVAWPIGSGASFEGCVDLVSMRRLSWTRVGLMSAAELSGEELALARARRARLVEELAEAGSEPAVGWFVEGVEPGPEELWAALARACAEGRAQPAAPMSAYRNQGVEFAMEMAGRCLPSPSDRGFDPEGAFSALVFKTEAGVGGQKAFARVMSGRMRASGSFEHARSGSIVGASRMAAPMSGSCEPIESARAGDVVVFEGLRAARTGDTLRARGSSTMLEGVGVLEPVVGWRVEAKSKSESAKALEGLARLCVDDPSLRLGVGESGECVLWGQGDLHLEVAIERLAREHGVLAVAGAPEVAYAYRLAGKGRAWGVVDKQTGGKGQFAKVEVEAAPFEGQLFESALVGEAVPRKFVAAVERGARAAMLCLGSLGRPALGWSIRLLGGQAHAVDSSEMAFERAGFEAAKAAAQSAGLELMEPMGRIGAEMPSNCVGSMVQEISRRSWRVLGIVEGADGASLEARAPMSKLFGFVASARSAAGGRVSCQIQADGYEPAKLG